MSHDLHNLKRQVDTGNPSQEGLDARAEEERMNTSLDALLEAGCDSLETERLLGLQPCMAYTVATQEVVS